MCDPAARVNNLLIRYRAALTEVLILREQLKEAGVITASQLHDALLAMENK